MVHAGRRVALNLALGKGLLAARRGETRAQGDGGGQRNREGQVRLGKTRNREGSNTALDKKTTWCDCRSGASTRGRGTKQSISSAGCWEGQALSPWSGGQPQARGTYRRGHHPELGLIGQRGCRRVLPLKGAADSKKVVHPVALLASFRPACAQCIAEAAELQTSAGQRTAGAFGAWGERVLMEVGKDVPKRSSYFARVESHTFLSGPSVPLLLEGQRIGQTSGCAHRLGSQKRPGKNRTSNSGEGRGYEVFGPRIRFGCREQRASRGFREGAQERRSGGWGNHLER